MVHQALAAVDALAEGAIVLQNATPNRLMLLMLQHWRRQVVVLRPLKIIRRKVAQALFWSLNLLRPSIPAGVKILGVNEEFGQSAYTAGELYAKHGMDTVAVTAAGKALATQATHSYLVVGICAA